MMTRRDFFRWGAGAAAILALPVAMNPEKPKAQYFMAVDTAIGEDQTVITVMEDRDDGEYRYRYVRYNTVLSGDTLEGYAPKGEILFDSI